MGNLSRLLYISRLADAINDECVNSILSVSRDRNAENGITGVLVVGGEQFIQILEGEEKNLIRLYAKIIDDSRHHDCTLIGVAPIDSRMFQKWSMGCIKKAPEKMVERRQQLLSYRSHPNHGEELLRLMKRYVAMLKEE